MFVRLPNKTDCERWAIFSRKTACYITEWLAGRAKDCGHDLLFHNSIGGPLLPETIHRELCRTFCKMYSGEIIHAEGLDVGRLTACAIRWRATSHRVEHPFRPSWGQGDGSRCPRCWATPRTTKRRLAEVMTRQCEGSKRASNLPTSTRSLSLDEFLAQYVGDN